MKQQVMGKKQQKFIGLWLSAELAQRLEAKAVRQGRSLSAIVRELLREDLDR